LEHALEIEPELPQALATLGYVYRRQAEELSMGPERIEKFNLAEAKLLEALRISPRLIDDDGESWWGSLGGLYRRQGQVDQAIYAYEQAAKVTPRSSYPFSNLALLFMAKRDRQAMLQTYEKVEQLALTESQAEANNYWAFGDLLTSRLALGKVELADATLASLFYTTPAGSSYSLELVIETLERLMEALGGPQEAPHIPPYIQQIREHIDRYQPNPASESGLS
jgi:tetratricopeptide (TPR) repeat protein